MQCLSAAQTFDYIVLMINPGLTSCKDLAMVVDITLDNNYSAGPEECLHNWSGQNLTMRTMQLNAWVADSIMILKSFFYLLYYSVITLKC